MESGCGCLPALTRPREYWPCPASPPPPALRHHTGAFITWAGSVLERCSSAARQGWTPWKATLEADGLALGLPSYQATCKEVSLSHLPGAPIGPVNVARTAWHLFCNHIPEAICLNGCVPVPRSQQGRGHQQHHHRAARPGRPLSPAGWRWSLAVAYSWH